MYCVMRASVPSLHNVYRRYDNLGFPYLNPVCYYVMVGNNDCALQLCTPGDASERVQNVLKVVRDYYNNCSVY